jgi:hypothetical protein
MTRYSIVAALLVLLFATGASAADQPLPPNEAGKTTSSDPSSGAKEQSSAPAGSGAAEDLSDKSSMGASGDPSTGAQEQSSAPPGSAAATGQPASGDKAMGSDKP